MFPRTIDEIKSAVDSALVAYFESLKCRFDYGTNLAEGMEYSVMNGGKRLRPIFLALAYSAGCRQLGKVADINECMPFCIAIELIHSYSLVHDDLPCMDDDDMRRGKPSTHSKYGEAVGVLVGDALLNAAAELLTGCAESKDIRNATRAANRLFAYSGVYGMVGGQSLDISLTKENVTIEGVLKTYEGKTCALFSAALQSGAELSGLDANASRDFGEFGKQIGIAFQIVDDILNVTSTKELMGKSVGSDKEKGKLNILDVLSIDDANEMARCCTEKGIAIMVQYDESAAIVNLARDILSRKG